MLNLLASSEKFVDRLLDGALMFPIGILVVFFGIAFIILCISIAGMIINKPEKEVKPIKEEVKKEIEVVSDNNEIPAEIKAGIIAVISAYYFAENNNCEFVVKKIKRL